MRAYVNWRVKSQKDSAVEMARAWGLHRYNLLVVEQENKVILRPSVSTKGIDTLVIEDIFGEEVQALLSKVDGIKIYYISRVEWADDRGERRGEEVIG